MDSRTAIAILVGLAAILTAGILFFLFRAIRILSGIEEATTRLEKTAIPLIENLRTLTGEIEPVVRRLSHRYQELDGRIETISRSPLFSLLSPFLRQGGTVRFIRGLFAGLSKAREVLKQSGQGVPLPGEKPPALTTQNVNKEKP